ncbi:MAG: hypothetical protein E6G50_11230 [Actinobacteria bacterium]|nr:MAG: hypothetical protein E6G50_11230 [Actinomycetota bacterium]
MLRLPLCCALTALVVVPAAFAGGPSPGVTQDASQGVQLPEGDVSYVAEPDGAGTTLLAVRERDGGVLRQASLAASWGIPLVAMDGTTGGLSADGRTLVLGDASQYNGPLRSSSRFLVVDTATLRTRAEVRLRGDYGYDALSPDGTTLYLIQHVSSRDIFRYVVRAYDLAHGRLLPGRIADRTQRGWVMQGFPLERVTSPDGRMAYTFYANPGGYPFIHALDTVHGTAHCIGVPWRAQQNGLSKLQMTLARNQLRLGWPGGRTFISVDTTTYRLARPATAGGDFPWWAVAVGGSILLAAVGGGIVRRGNNT